MKRVTSRQSETLAKLSDTLGDRTLRQLLTPESKRLMRPERMENLRSGRGRISEREAVELQRISKNSQQLKALKKRAAGKQEFKTNRALRTWLNKGKEKDEDSSEVQTEDEKLAVIRSLWYFGVDPADGTFYVRKES